MNSWHDPRNDYFRAMPAIHSAAYRGDLRRVMSLVARGTDPDLCVDVSSYDLKMRPLHFAAMMGHADIVHLLLDIGCDIEAPGANASPLRWAVSKGEFEVAKLLLRRGASVSSVGHLDRVLRYDDPRDAEEMLRLLFSYGAPPKDENDVFMLDIYIPQWRELVPFVRFVDITECMIPQKPEVR